MSKKALAFEEMPSNPIAPKKASAHSGHGNSFVAGKKGKKKGHKKHSHK